MKSRYSSWNGREKKVEKKKNGQKWMLAEHTHGRNDWEWGAHRETERMALRLNERASEREQEEKEYHRINYERIQFRFLGTLKRLWIRNEIRTVLFHASENVSQVILFTLVFFLRFCCMCARCFQFSATIHSYNPNQEFKAILRAKKSAFHERCE